MSGIKHVAKFEGEKGETTGIFFKVIISNETEYIEIYFLRDLTCSCKHILLGKLF